MATFLDSEGDSWVLDLDVTLLKQLRAQGVDLLHTDVDKASTALGKLIEDPIFLVDTIYLLCKEQADKRGISDEQFGRLVGKGNNIDLATGALVEALADFSPRRGEVLKLATKKIKQAEEKLSQKALELLNELNLDEVTEHFGKSLTNSLEPSKLTPDHSNLES